jgi:hypothetical protein
MVMYHLQDLGGTERMRHKGLKPTRNKQERRARKAAAPAVGQYSLFAAASIAPDADARHFLRQAQLCQRLLSGLHQADLVELLGRLHEEFEAKAAVDAGE